MLKKLFTGLFAIFLFTNLASANDLVSMDDDSLNLTNRDKAYILARAYGAVKEYFNPEIQAKYLPKMSHNFEFSRMFVTLTNKWQIRCCQSASVAPNSNNIFNYIQKASVRCIQDDRFGGEFNEYEIQDMGIVINFLYSPQKIPSNTLPVLRNYLELGIHGIWLSVDGKSAFFKESVPITHNYDLQKTLERLCVKADQDKDCWQDSSTDIYRYNTLTFKMTPDFQMKTLYRYNELVELSDIDLPKIKDSIQLTYEWFTNSINSLWLVQYQYFPSYDQYDTDNNEIRQMASTWMIWELQEFLDKDELTVTIKKTLDYYFDEKVDKTDFIFFDLWRSVIAHNAFMIMMLLTVDEYPNKDELLTKLANGIIRQQNDDGSFDTYFYSTRNSGQDFYPGEAMLALMKLYEYNPNEQYLEVVKKAFDYYPDYWKNNKNTAFIPWQTQVYYKLYQYDPDPKYVDFIFEMNDWIIDNYRIIDHKYPDMIWWAPKPNPTMSTASYMEWLTDAYALAVQVNDQKRIKVYWEILRLGTRFLLQLQYTPDNTFYLENPVLAMWGIRKSLTQAQIRNDNTQHAAAALMKVYKNNLFEE